MRKNLKRKKKRKNHEKDKNKCLSKNNWDVISKWKISTEKQRINRCTLGEPWRTWALCEVWTACMATCPTAHSNSVRVDLVFLRELPTHVNRSINQSVHSLHTHIWRINLTRRYYCVSSHQPAVSAVDQMDWRVPFEVYDVYGPCKYSAWRRRERIREIFRGQIPFCLNPHNPHLTLRNMKKCYISSIWRSGAKTPHEVE